MRFNSNLFFGKNLNRSLENHCEERGLLWNYFFMKNEWEKVWDGKDQVKLETCVLGCVNEPTSTTYTHNICA
jgi:hypothetical protein